VINIVLPFTLITMAEQSVESALAAILNGAVPLVVIVLAAMVFHDEPITVNRLVGLLVGYAGVIILVSRGLAGGGSDDALLGELALLGSTVAYGVGAVYSRRNVHGLRPMIPAVFQVGFAFVIVGVLALVLERPLDVAWNIDAVFSVTWLGLLGSGVAYLVLFRLLKRIGATRTSLVSYLLPVVGIAAGAVMFDERVDEPPRRSLVDPVVRGERGHCGRQHAKQTRHGLFLSRRAGLATPILPRPRPGPPARASGRP